MNIITVRNTILHVYVLYRIYIYKEKPRNFSHLKNQIDILLLVMII